MAGSRPSTCTSNRSWSVVWNGLVIWICPAVPSSRLKVSWARPKPHDSSRRRPPGSQAPPRWPGQRPRRPTRRPPRRWCARRRTSRGRGGPGSSRHRGAPHQPGQPTSDVALRVTHHEMEVRLDLPQFADRTGCEQAVDALHLVMEREDERLPQRCSGLAGHRQHVLGLGQRARQRFLAQHRLACLQRPDRPLPVQAVRQRDVEASTPGSSIRPWYPVTARPIMLSRAQPAVRSGSRPATTAACPPASRTAGRKSFRAMLAVPMIPHRTALLPPALPPPALPPTAPPPLLAPPGHYPSRAGARSAVTIEKRAATGRTGRTVGHERVIARPSVLAVQVGRGHERGILRRSLRAATIFDHDGDIDPGRPASSPAIWWHAGSGRRSSPAPRARLPR